MRLFQRRGRQQDDATTLIQGVVRPQDYTCLPEPDLDELVEVIRVRIEAHAAAGSIDFATRGVLNDFIDARFDDMREHAANERGEHQRLVSALIGQTKADLKRVREERAAARSEVRRLQQLVGLLHREIVGQDVPAPAHDQPDVPDDADEPDPDPADHLPIPINVPGGAA